MTRYRALAAILLCFVGLSLLVALFESATTVMAPQPADGRLYLTRWDFTRDGGASLAGE